MGTRIPFFSELNPLLPIHTSSCDLEQEPVPPLALVDPILQQARCGYVPSLIAQFMCLPHTVDELPLILP